MRKFQLLKNVKHRLQNADIYVTRGVKSEYRKGMKLFWWYGFLISTSSAFVNSYVTLYALALGASSLQIGTLASLSSFMSMLAPIPGAQWSARWGRKKWVVVISFGLRRLALLFALLIPFMLSGQAAIIVLIALMALRAGLGSLGTPAWSSFAGDLVPLERRGRYFSSRKSVMALASLLSVPVAGQIIEWINPPHGYQVSFAISVLFGALALYYYSQIPERPLAKVNKDAKRFATFWHTLAGNRTFLLFTLFSMVFNFAWQMGGPYFGVYQVKVLGATPAIVGILSMLSSLARIVGQQFWGRVIDRHGAQWTLTLCRLLIPILPFIWLPLTNPWQLLFVVIPSGFLWPGHELANFNLQLELSDEEYRTQAIASYTALIGIANMLGPLVGGVVVDRMSYGWDFAFSGIGRLVGALLIMALLKPFRPMGKASRKLS